jgi:hypothetical protein
VVRDAASLCDWHFRGRDLNALVNLNRIAIDDFPAETEGQLDSERALPGSRRANDGDDAGIADVPSAFFSF